MSQFSDLSLTGIVNAGLLSGSSRWFCAFASVVVEIKQVSVQVLYGELP